MRSDQWKAGAGGLGLLLGLTLASVAVGQALGRPRPRADYMDKLGVTGFHNRLA